MPFPSTPPPLPGIVHTDVRVDRVRWHVATAGDGPPLVLLHGWPQHWWAWRRIIPELARTHRVYAPDLRGFGWSDAPAGRYSKMGLACDVERLLDELGVETCTLVGHDWGAFVAMLTAIRAPERVQRVAALSMPHPWMRVPKGDPRGALRIAAYQLPISTPVLGATVLRRAPFLLREGLKRTVAPGFRWDAGDLRLYSDQWTRPDHARASSAVYRTFLTKELPAIARGRYANRRLDMPLLLATGDHDGIVTPERLGGYERFAPQGRATVVEGAGHWLLDERPARVLELIREELQR